MKDLRELYTRHNYLDYDEVLESFEYEIVVQVDDDDYQGDTRVIFKDGERYGFLIFGWGSCSGCDALEACNNFEEIEQLQNELFNNIQWFDNLKDLKQYVNNKDFELEFYWREETKEFINQVLGLEETL